MVPTLPGRSVYRLLQTVSHRAKPFDEKAILHKEIQGGEKGEGKEGVYACSGERQWVCNKEQEVTGTLFGDFVILARIKKQKMVIQIIYFQVRMCSKYEY